MTKKALVGVVVLLCLSVTMYLFWTARVARNASANILSKFKKIDSALIRSNDSFSKNERGVGAFETDSTNSSDKELSMKVEQVLANIDSTKNDLTLLMDEKGAKNFSYPDMQKIKTLKSDLSGLNSYVRKNYSAYINSNNLVDIADIRKGTAFIPWEVYYFENTNVYAAITTLTFVKGQVLKLQQKAMHAK